MIILAASILCISFMYKRDSNVNSFYDCIDGLCLLRSRHEL